MKWWFNSDSPTEMSRYTWPRLGWMQQRLQEETTIPAGRIRTEDEVQLCFTLGTQDKAWQMHTQAGVRRGLHAGRSCWNNAMSAQLISGIRKIVVPIQRQQGANRSQRQWSLASILVARCNLLDGLFSCFPLLSCCSISPTIRGVPGRRQTDRAHIDHYAVLVRVRSAAIPYSTVKST